MVADRHPDNPQTLRPLLPSADVPQGEPNVSRPILKLRHRPAQVSAACNTCRRHKARCDGGRPSCRRCVHRAIECHYTTRPGETEAQARTRSHSDLRDVARVNNELIELLRKLPDKDAQSVLARIRAGIDAATIVSHVRTGDLLVQMAVAPETRFRYEFPYRKCIPADYVAGNAYLDSLLYEASSLYSSGAGPGQLGRGSAGRMPDLALGEHQSFYLRPFHAAELVDPGLSSASISAWTSVCDDEALMRDLLGTWLRCEYQFTAAFQKDLFLQDMAAGRNDFCSSLLVNIALGYACVCYPRFSTRAQYWNPNTLMYRFVAEAKRLWELESTEPKITTIQAGILFNVYYNLCGLDAVGQGYRTQAIALAHEMHLFNCDEDADERTRHGTAFAAWALFNWETLVGFSFVFAPLLSNPPEWTLPDPAETPEWYGEILVRYPLSDRPLPTYFGQMFKVRSLFRMLMNEACQVAYSKGSEMTLTLATGFLSRLKSWYDNLPEPLSSKRIVLPHHLQLHMYYHHLVLTLFEPFHDLDTLHDNPPPAETIADAKKNLYTLVHLYYLRHGYEAMDLFIVIPLMLAASDCLERIDTPTTTSAQLEDLRSILILSAKGLHHQRHNHFLAEALFRVIRGRMRAQELALFRRTVTNAAENHEGAGGPGGDGGSGGGGGGVPDDEPELAQEVRSHWPVAVVRRKEDRDEYMLTKLVDNYAHLNIEK